MRARYGHGGRLGYDREWRAVPEVSGGGELLDQGMHLLDLSHWLLGPLPLHSALLRTSYWDMPVEDNAVLTLAEPGGAGPFSTFHVSWSEWKNEFALDVYTRTTKLAVSGLAGSYGPQTLRIWRMGPEMGPPELEEVAYPATDRSWEAEWAHFRPGSPIRRAAAARRPGVGPLRARPRRGGLPASRPAPASGGAGERVTLAAPGLLAGLRPPPGRDARRPSTTAGWWTAAGRARRTSPTSTPAPRAGRPSSRRCTSTRASSTRSTC